MKSIGLLLLGTTLAHAQLAVTVSPVKVTGQKAIVPLVLKNSFGEKVESARATVFLADDQGKVVGHSTRWVIGDATDRQPLDSKKETKFNFVVPADKTFTTTNLTPKISFNRIVLEGGKLADSAKDVQIQQDSK